MKRVNFLIASLIVFSGCAKKKDPDTLRFCTPINATFIHKLIPHDYNSLEKYSRKIESEVEALSNQLKQIEPRERDFYNTLRVYDLMYLKLWMGSQIYSMLGELHANDQMRSAAHSAASKINQLKDRLYRSKEIEQALEEYKKYGSDKKHQRKDVQKYLEAAINHHKNYQHKKDGVDSLLSQFNNNIWQSVQPVLGDANQLAGLSKSYKTSLQKNDQGLLEFSLDYESFFEIMEHANDAELRKNYFHAFGSRGYPENINLIEKIVKKRNHHARELGYDSFVEYKIVDHAITDLKKVESFLWQQVNRLQAQEEKIYKKMLKHKPESVTLSDDGKLYPWDETFLKAYFRKNILDVDDLKIARYFSAEKTVQKILHLYEQFFSISFHKETEYSWWAQDISLYRVTDQMTKELIGYVFFDLYNREGKHQEQKHITLLPGIRDDCNLPCASISVVVCDFDSSKSNQTGLELHEVKSLIHEIGHAVHACYGSTDFAEQSGTQVARDFVELPAQIFEAWLEEPAILKRLSSHIETGEILSDQEIKKIIQAQKYVAISQLLKQTFIALLMIELYKNEDQNPHHVAQELYKRVYPYLVSDPDYFIECNIEHFISYGPSYYSYVWTKILAEKLFKKIKKRGILHSSVGRQFSKHILMPGASGNYQSMIRAFTESI
jgi:thimet oligopeptidase